MDQLPFGPVAVGGVIGPKLPGMAQDLSHRFSVKDVIG